MTNTIKNLLTGLADNACLYSKIPYVIGYMRGRRDLKGGRLVLKTFGPPAKWRPVYAEMLKTKYGVSLEAVSDGFVNERLREEIRGYNRAMKRMLTQRYGHEFLSMVVERAKDRHLREQAELEKAAHPPAA